MLRSAFPRAHQKYFSLPLLGPIADGFDDWLAASGFTQGSRKLAINLMPIADKKLRRRGVDEVAKLNHAVLDDCCKALKKKYPCRAGTIHTLERYLLANRLIVDHRQAAATQPSTLSGEYADHLREVRGFAASTVSSHRRTAECFLQHLEETGVALRTIRTSNIEAYFPGFRASTPHFWQLHINRQMLSSTFIDEAGQMSLANVLAVAQAAEKIVLLGDPQQLEQPLRGSHPPGASASALEHLLDGAKTIQADRGRFLDKTWRMHPSLCSFTSEAFYEGRLESHPDMRNQRISGHPWLGENGLWYIPYHMKEIRIRRRRK